MSKKGPGYEYFSDAEWLEGKTPTTLGQHARNILDKAAVTGLAGALAGGIGYGAVQGAEFIAGDNSEKDAAKAIVAQYGDKPATAKEIIADFESKVAKAKKERADKIDNKAEDVATKFGETGAGLAAAGLAAVALAERRRKKKENQDVGIY